MTGGMILTALMLVVMILLDKFIPDKVVDKLAELLHFDINEESDDEWTC